MNQTPSRMTIQEWQAKVKETLSPVQHPRLGAILALTEELGEVVKEIMALEIYGSKSNTPELANELADLMVALLEVASVYDIDLEHVLRTRLQDLQERMPEWQQSFGNHLAKRRKQFDGPNESSH